MGEHTAIAWCNHTFSPWWGCQRVSPACEHCYAEAFAWRLGHNGRSLPVAGQGPPRAPKPLLWGPKSERRFFGAKHWREPRKWNADARREGRRHRVFCASMADVFEAREDLEAERGQLWELILETPWLDWQLLTKRPENLATMLPWGRYGMGPTAWRNVWLGVTAESQEWAERRIPTLLSVEAAVRFVSYEPALGRVDLARWLGPGRIMWVISGGESGGQARPYDLTWANDVAHQCREAGAAFFHKRLGARPRDVDGLAIKLRDRHGGDIGEWPDTVSHRREFPQVSLGR